MNTRTFVSFAAAAAIAALAGTADAALVYGLTTDNRLVSFDSATPGAITNLGSIGGLAAPGETVVGIDLRPATGQVFAVGSSSTVYSLSIAPGNVTASPIGPSFTPVLTSGVEYGIDFNPTVDRIRVVASNGENRRLNPVNGTSAGVDTSLTFAAGPFGGTPRAVGTAYTNSLAGAPLGSIRQFIIDSTNDILGEVGSQAGGNASFNGGVVTGVGALGFDTNDLVGFDIFGPTGGAFLSLTDPSSNLSSFYSLNLATGGASFIGSIGTGVTLRDITVVPAPGVAGLALVGGLAGLRRRR